MDAKWLFSALALEKSSIMTEPLLCKGGLCMDLDIDF